MEAPRVKINYEVWNKDNGLRITTITGHGGGNNMYSVAHARELARLLNEACDEVEEHNNTCKEAFIAFGKKLGFIDT